MTRDAVVLRDEMQQVRRARRRRDVMDHVIARRQVHDAEIAQVVEQHLLLLGARDRTFGRIEPEHRRAFTFGRNAAAFAPFTSFANASCTSALLFANSASYQSSSPGSVSGGKRVLRLVALSHASRPISFIASTRDLCPIEYVSFILSLM